MLLSSVSINSAAAGTCAAGALVAVARALANVAPLPPPPTAADPQLWRRRSLPRLQARGFSSDGSGSSSDEGGSGSGGGTTKRHGPCAAWAPPSSSADGAGTGGGAWAPPRGRTEAYQAAAAAAAVASAPPGAPADVTLSVNGRRVALPRGSTLLDAVHAAGASVPTLCKLPGRSTPGSCRLCMVDVNGVHKAACCTPAVDGSYVTTDTPEVRSYVRGLLSLMRANHVEDCMTCDAAGRCEFQALIGRYKAPLLPKLRAASPDYREAAAHFSAHDESSPAIALDREKCVKCGRCVEACQDVQRMNVLGWFGRGRERHIGFLCDSDMTASACISCGQCVAVCPVGALSERTHWRAVLDELAAKRKVMVAQTAPAVRVAIGEELGLPPGAATTPALVAGLRALGFDHVFDTDFSADLTIMEEGTELLQRLKAAADSSATSADSSTGNGNGNGASTGSNYGAAGAARAASAAAGPLPLFTSCCPGWVSLVEQEFPEFIPNLSSCKSPQQMLGAVVKEVWAPRQGLKPEDVALVSIMPCTAKKFEAARPEHTAGAGGPPHVDYVLTTRELGRLFRLKGISLAGARSAADAMQAAYDSPMGAGTGAAVLFGNSGGVTEAAVRTVYELATGAPLPKLDFEAVRGMAGVKRATVQLPLAAAGAGAGGGASGGGSPAAAATKELRIAVVSGIANARRLLSAMRAGDAPPLDFVEVMTCAGGCVGGGGQPKSRDADAVAKRMRAVYTLDASAPLRKSHENPEVAALYSEALGGAPGSHAAHALLHTTYPRRPKLV